MQNDEMAPGIEEMLDSTDELTVTVAELWRRVQGQRRQLEALEERLKHMPGPVPPAEDGTAPPGGG
jgi:uncharacterized coiled-coil protein SlyX